MKRKASKAESLVHDLPWSMLLVFLCVSLVSKHIVLSTTVMCVHILIYHKSLLCIIHTWDICAEKTQLNAMTWTAFSSFAAVISIILHQACPRWGTMRRPSKGEGHFSPLREVSTPLFGGSLGRLYEQNIALWTKHCICIGAQASGRWCLCKCVGSGPLTWMDFRPTAP